jgi:hypothetical protein
MNLSLRLSMASNSLTSQKFLSQQDPRMILLLLVTFHQRFYQDGYQSRQGTKLLFYTFLANSLARTSQPYFLERKYFFSRSISVEVAKPVPVKRT